MKTIAKLSLVAACAATLAGCGYTRGERAATGALGGAAAGAVLGGDLTGAVVGGAVGAAAGAVTAPENRERAPYRR